MTCSRCRKKYAASEQKCPYCGQERPGGVFQTSSVLISAGGADKVYRSVEEVPASLRTKLIKSTNSSNSATILIADRRGRAEIARVMRSLPGAPQRRTQRTPLRSLLAGEQPAGRGLTRARKRAIYAAILLIVLTLSALLVVYLR